MSDIRVTGLKLWLAERDERLVGYDEFAGWVLSAVDEDQARCLTGYEAEAGFTIKQIGEASPGDAAGIILGSFNAG